jgi:metal-dependent amidase/aminoacylase/carboxypeptidase family protein
VVVIGAPAEETIGGKIVLAARGAYAGVDAALLAHPGVDDRAFVRSLASWSVDVVFEGRPAHAVSAPERGVNALDALIRLFVAKATLAREFDGAALLPGVILEGGVRPNLVPDRTRARFSLRAGDAAFLVETVLPRFRAIAEDAARATGARVAVTPVDNLYHEVVENPVLTEIYSRWAREAGLNLVEGPGRPIGSLDVGVLSQRVPVLHSTFRIAERPLATHTPEFTSAAAGPEALAAAQRVALALAWTGLELLTVENALARSLAFLAARRAWAPPAGATPLVTSQPEG